jgi:hypothetical protein
VPFTTVVAAVAGASPTGPWAEDRPSRSTSSGSSSGRRKRSTAGKRRASPPRSRSRTAQPVRTTRIPAFEAFSARRTPCRPITFASAASRIAQVLMTTRSAVSIDGASAHPAARSRPAISSESLRFIWQPSVQTQRPGPRSSAGTRHPCVDRLGGCHGSRPRSAAGRSRGRGAPAGSSGARRRVLMGRPPQGLRTRRPSSGTHVSPMRRHSCPSSPWKSVPPRTSRCAAADGRIRSTVARQAPVVDLDPAETRLDEVADQGRSARAPSRSGRAGRPRRRGSRPGRHRTEPRAGRTRAAVPTIRSKASGRPGRSPRDERPGDGRTSPATPRRAVESLELASTGIPASAARACARSAADAPPLALSRASKLGAGITPGRSGAAPVRKSAASGRGR